MRRFKTIASAVVVALVVITCVDYAASAATGGKFILGQLNKANKQTTLKRTTNGPALRIVTKSSGAAPLATNGRGRIGNLNADLLDGLDSSALKTTARVFTRDVPNVFMTNNYDQALPLGVGTYLIAYSAHLIGPSAERVNCFLRSDPAVGSTSYTAQDSTGAGGAVSGSGVVIQAPGTVNSLVCSSATTAFSTAASEPIQVVAVRLDTVATTSLNPVPD